MEFKEKNIQIVLNDALGYFNVVTVESNPEISKFDNQNIISEFLKILAITGVWLNGGFSV